MVHEHIWETSKLNPRNKYCKCGSWMLEGKIFCNKNNYSDVGRELLALQSSDSGGMKQ